MVAKINDNTPILVGAGQVVLREVECPEQAKSPVELAAQALQLALDNSGCTEIGDAVDTLLMSRLYHDSVPKPKHPFGNSNKPPLSVAKQLGLRPQRLVYSEIGGQIPQRFINDYAKEIYEGNCELVAICGAEAMGIIKKAQRHDWKLDWNDSVEGDIEIQKTNNLGTKLEWQHHLIFPIQIYALMENVWRHKHQLSIHEHRQLMGRLLAQFSAVAADNPYAQFPTARSEAFISQPSKQNYPVNDAYNKWMVAQDAVNQGAAVILTSVGKARQLGIDEEHWVYLHGYADSDDYFISERINLSSSVALEAAYEDALSMANKRVDDINLFDLYSCFPIAVLAACDALDLDWQDPRGLTITGGLPFFGGAGNNYSLHAIAEMHQRLTANPGQFGLISANGGYLSKQSVGIYSTNPVSNWKPRQGNPAQERVNSHAKETVLFPFEGEAYIESYSVIYLQSTPALGFVICRDTATNHRVLAKVQKGDEKTLQALISSEPIGRKVLVHTAEKGCFFSFI